MADYYLILKRALEREPDLEAHERAALYDKARGALARQLDALDPQPEPDQIARVQGTLEDAIARLEAEVLGAQTSEEPIDRERAAPEPVEPAPEPAAPAPATPVAPPAPAYGNPSPATPMDSAVQPSRAAGDPARLSDADGSPAPKATDDRSADAALTQATALVDNAARMLAGRNRSGETERRAEAETPQPPSTTGREPDEAFDDTDLDADPTDDWGSDTDWSPGPPPFSADRRAAASDEEALWPTRRSTDRGSEDGARRTDGGTARSATRTGAPKATGAALPQALAKRRRGRKLLPLAAAAVAVVLVLIGVGFWQREALVAAVSSPAPAANELAETAPDTPPSTAVKNGERITADGVAAAPEPAPSEIATATATTDPVRDVGGDAISPPVAAEALEDGTPLTDTAALSVATTR